MHLTFTSETVNPFGSSVADPVDNGTLFRLYREGEEIGSFRGTVSQGQYEIEGDRYAIRMHPRIFRKDEYALLRNGEPYLQDIFTIPSYLIWRGFEASMALPVGRFLAKREKTGIRYNLFDRSTWGHYRMTLSDGHRTLDYRFRRMAKKVVHLIPDHLPMEGKITGDITDLSVILPGLCLILRLLDYEEVT